MSRAGADPGGRSHKARRSGLTGRRAEWLAILWLSAKGYRLLERRFGGKGGEIDLILSKDDEYIFVEVKKSARHATAAERIGAHQIARICTAAQEFCGGLSTGLLTMMRFDAALVDQVGRVEIIENAFGMN